MSRLRHGYAPSYARNLRRHIRNPAPVIVEVGILRGSGLAIWCDLIPPAGAVFGLDVDLEHFERNRAALDEAGAFSRNTPELLLFDAYAPDSSGLERLLAGRHIDVVIDDGPHTIESIIRTATALRPLLASDFTYFIEDNPDALDGAKKVLRPNGAVRDVRGLLILSG